VPNAGERRWVRRADDQVVAHIPALLAFSLFICSVGLEMNVPQLLRLQIYISPMILLTYVVLSPVERSRISRVRLDPLLMLLLVYCGITLGWSHAPAAEARRELMLLMIGVLIGHVIAGLYPARLALRGLATAAAVMCVAVLLDAVARPGLAFSPGPGDGDLKLGLRSFFYQKNSLGAALVMTFALLPCVERRSRRIAFTALLVVLLALCRSSTSILAVIAITATQWLIRRIVRERREGRPGSVFLAGAGAILALATVATLKNRIYGLFGKDSTLSGRDDIWRESIRAARHKPWFGYGVDGFWGVPNGPVALLRHAVGFDVAGAHQGVIELVLEFGLVGLVLFVALYGSMVLRAARLMMAGNDSPPVLAAIGILVGCFVTTLTEGGLIRPALMSLSVASAVLMSEGGRVSTRTATAAPRRRRTDPAAV
jgi:O-antigen ligase